MITPKEYAISFYESLDQEQEYPEKKIKAFVNILIKNKDLDISNDIISEFEKYYREKNKILDVEISSAKKLDAENIDTIKKIFGKETKFKEIIEPSLIGGVILKIGNNLLIDNTIKKRLQRIQQIK